MVSVSILVVMILAFSIVLNQSQRVVTTAQRIMKANESALAIAQTMRSDFSSISRDGYLKISSVGGRPIISFTAAGLYRSLLDDATATAARIDYGCNSDNVMWRRVTLLDPTRPASTDRIMRSLSDCTDPNVCNTDLISSSPAPPALSHPTFTVPPNNLGDVDLLRSYLAGNCSFFQISYVASTVTTAAWRAPTVWTGPVTADVPAWYSTNRDQWPLAIRIAFTLGEYDDAAPFEVIVPVP
jgi:hypothetical protein